MISMKDKLKRIYKDKMGKQRTLVKLEEGYRVKWHKDAEESDSTRWETEDSHVIQIPNNAWDYFSIEYEDMYE